MNVVNFTLITLVILTIKMVDCGVDEDLCCEPDRYTGIIRTYKQVSVLI